MLLSGGANKKSCVTSSASLTGKTLTGASFVMVDMIPRSLAVFFSASPKDLLHCFTSKTCVRDFPTIFASDATTSSLLFSSDVLFLDLHQLHKVIAEAFACTIRNDGEVSVTRLGNKIKHSILLVNVNSHLMD